MLISKTQFLRYQEVFYQKLLKTPHEVFLEVFSVHHKELDEDVFSFERFVGDSERTSSLHKVNALYEKEIPSRMRDKYGLSTEVSGIVYVSPKQLKPIFGSYIVPPNTTKIRFGGRTQVIEKVVYLEELYGSCVGVQIFVKDDIRGG